MTALFLKGYNEKVILGLNNFSKKEIIRLGAIGVILFVCALVWLPSISGARWFEPECECLTVSFLNVGQGDAILIETPGGHRALVDGGPDASVLRELGRELSFFDRTLDMVVATHPDADHIGGLAAVLKRYVVSTIVETTNGKETPVVEVFVTAVNKEKAGVIYAEAGQVVALGDGVNLRILSPAGDETEWESNTASIVIRVEYGSTSVMLTGDAPSEIEDYLVKAYPDFLKSDVLKLGHHGSKTSTSDAWLETVSPQYAVVSAGIGNRYGHPHQDVMQRVFARNIKTAHTGTDGTVTFVSDGKTVWKK